MKEPLSSRRLRRASSTRRPRRRRATGDGRTGVQSGPDPYDSQPGNLPETRLRTTVNFRFPNVRNRDGAGQWQQWRQQRQQRSPSIPLSCSFGLLLSSCRPPSLRVAETSCLRLPSRQPALRRASWVRPGWANRALWVD